jgi:hypothetical protein
MAHRVARTRHTLNGKLLGIYYETEGGHRIYLAHRQMRHLNRKFNGWSIDTGTLARCREQGFLHVGVVARRGGKKCVWLSPLEDFFHPEKSFVTRTPLGLERGVRCTHFAVDPANDPRKIDLAFPVR